MDFAFVFPGQGSQTVGMLDSFSNYPIVRETLEEASEVLSQDLSSLIHSGPIEELSLTVNTQPVMLAASYACYRVWQQLGGAEPSILAGHSLGEYTALVVSGALRFTDAIALVRFRAEAMQSAVPFGTGGMAAILGLDDETVQMICAQAAEKGVVEAVNFNAPAQVVIAGEKAAVEAACVLAKEKGAKRALMLPVSAPFHSSLLLPASQRLKEYLADVSIETPKIAVVNNIDVKVQNTSEAIKDALVRQAAGPVRWVECVRYIANTGVGYLVECGPGKVLSGLTKRIDERIQSASLATLESVEQTLELFA